MQNNYDARVKSLDAALRVGESFDLIKRELRLTSGRAAMYYLDGFVKDEVSEKLIEFYLKSPPEDLAENIPYTEVEAVTDVERMLTAVLSGSTLLVCEALPDARIIDTRSYPTRSVEEPENDKVLRGSRDGFTETLIFNTALIRRRIRDPRLTYKIFNLTEYTRTDVALAYIDGRCDPVFLDKVKKKLEGISVKALNFSIESIAECLVRRRWYNPFPKFRYTERPDAAAAALLEGDILVICDNCPSVMLLPVSIFGFFQESGDFYLPPLTSAYLRLLRFVVSLLTLLLTPTWYLLVEGGARFPGWLDVMSISEPSVVPLLVQLLLIELAIDGLKLASLNAPSSLNNTFSVVGGLILGDFAVKSGWFAPDVILYMAFIAIGSFAQPSYELSYAFKFMRVLTLLLTAAFGLWGYIAGLVIIVVSVASQRTVDGGHGYLYPLVPFDGRALSRLVIRHRLK